MRTWVRLALLAGFLVAMLWLALEGPMSCFGCGGIEFAADTTDAERAAAIEQMRNAVVTLITVSALLLTLLLGVYVAMRPREPEDDL